MLAASERRHDLVPDLVPELVLGHISEVWILDVAGRPPRSARGRLTPRMNDWIVIHRPNPAARLRLVCLPFAGGGAIAYRGWDEHLPAGVELAVLLPPGRERRLGEVPIADPERLVTEITRALRPLADRPFALFGHSMGALLAFETARRLRREGGPEPLRLFASGHRAPRLPYTKAPVRHLPDAAFADVLRDYDGTPPEVLASFELLSLVVPALRADLAVCETYVYAEDEPLACPITVLAGREDPDTRPAAVAPWHQETRATCDVHWFAGGHFYLQARRDELLALLSRELSALGA